MSETPSRDKRERDIVWIDVDRLLIDPQNPRLSSSATEHEPTQFELARILWTEMAVDELVLSIAANGYFPEEPLFVVPKSPGDEDTDYIVVEGNRRLAAVRILLDDDLRGRLRATGMPELDEAEKEALQELPASVYGDREELWAFLSFRHINSPQAWDAYSKAKYVALVHDDYGIDLNEIARRIGDQHQTVQRMYRGYKVLRQAEEEGVFDIEDQYRNRFYFSHLYTALAYSEFQEFLGIEPGDFEKDNPVSDDHVDELEELMIWLYGKRTEGIEPAVRKQAPHLNWLREVISDPAALDALRSGYPLERTREISLGDERRFRESLTRARQELQQAKATVTSGYKGGDMQFERIEDIQKIARSIWKEMCETREAL